MSQFHDVRFPFALGFGARGGPVRLTEIVELASGREERNTPRAHARRRYDAGPGVKTLDDLSRLIDFFEERRGQLYAFRFTDPLDHKSCRPSQTPAATDQAIGTGDGSRTVFALTKTYGSGASAYLRPILYPVAGSVLAAVDGVPAAFGVSASGEIVFDAAPAPGSAVTAGYEFDVPVRFDTDRLDIALDTVGAGAAPSIPLIELRL